MNITEKILLVELLLEDIRGNWGWENDNDVCSRAIKAKDLCEEIANELGDDRFLTLANCCKDYIATYFEDGDGRYFRDKFPYGYEHMDVLHGLSPTFSDKSDKFKSIAEEYLTYPDNHFDDWDDRFNI